MAVVLVLEPIFEADLEPEQYAYRADRSALDAVRQVHGLVNAGHTEVVDADLSGLLRQHPARRTDEVAGSRRISDRHLLGLIKMWLEAPVEEIDERGRHHRTTRNKDEGRGTPARVSALAVAGEPLYASFRPAAGRRWGTSGGWTLTSSTMPTTS